MRNVEEYLHLAVIPDGNRRYAAGRGLSREAGHLAGAEKAVELLEWVEEYSSITEVTAWALSPANHRKRPEKEVDDLNTVYEYYADTLNYEESPVHEHSISVGTVGDISVLSREAQESITSLVGKTSMYDDKHLNLAFFYDADYDLDQALEAARADGIPNPLSEDLEQYYELGEVDILMRYGDDSAHLSGFAPMPQIEQATIVFPEKNWPEAERGDIDRALERHDRKKSEGA